MQLQGEEPVKEELQRASLFERLQQVHAALPVAGPKELKGLQSYYRELDIRGACAMPAFGRKDT